MNASAAGLDIHALRSGPTLMQLIASTLKLTRLLVFGFGRGPEEGFASRERD